MWLKEHQLRASPSIKLKLECGKAMWKQKKKLMNKSFCPISWTIIVTQAFLWVGPPQHGLYFSALNECSRGTVLLLSGLLEWGSVGCVSASVLAGDISYHLGRTEGNIKLHFHYHWGPSWPEDQNESILISLPNVFLGSLPQSCAEFAWEIWITFLSTKEGLQECLKTEACESQC